MKLTRALILVGITGAVLTVPARAVAQQAPGRGLFQTGPASTTGQHLDVTVSSAEAYDADNILEGQAIAGPNREPTGYSTLLSVAGNYAWLGRRSQLRAAGTSTLRRFRSIDDLALSSDRAASHSGVVSFTTRSTNTTFSANQSLAYSSSALYNFFPQSGSVFSAESPVAPPDPRNSNLELVAYGSSALLSHEFGRRTTLSTTIERNQSSALGDSAGVPRVTVSGVRNQISRRGGRNVILVSEYAYRIGDLGYAVEASGRTLAEHRVDFGADWKRALSATRHLDVSGRIGASTSVLPTADGVETIERRYGQFSGQLMIGYDLARNWKARGTFRRGLEYIAGLVEPVFSDSVTANLDGRLSRRLDVTASAGYSSGDSVRSRGTSVFDTYTGNARFRYAVTRSLAGYIEYVYYFYDFHGDVILAPAVPRNVERNSARAGFMLHLPGFGSGS